MTGVPSQPEGQIAGVDEVGKGALFGPVFAGAVVINEESAIHLKKLGLQDSKKLTSSKRKKLVPLIKRQAIAWGLGQASAREIDIFGIREATEKAMLRALNRLNQTPKLILVDGVLPLRAWTGDQITLIKGDNKSASIAAASVLAKEARDSLIKRIALKFPNYGLEKNVGYGTKFHCESLKIAGATQLHRQSFLSKILSK